MADDRRDLGAWGERVAALHLQRWGVEIVSRNQRKGRGEIDLIGRTPRGRFLIEVRTVRGAIDLSRAFPQAKRRQVRHLAGESGISRVDLVGVGVGPDTVDIHWLRDVTTG